MIGDGPLGVSYLGGDALMDDGSVVRFAFFSLPLSVSFAMPDIVTSDVTGFDRITTISTVDRITTLSVADLPEDA